MSRNISPDSVRSGRTCLANLGVRSCPVRKLICPVRWSPNLEYWTYRSQPILPLFRRTYGGRRAAPTRSNCALRAKQEHREPSPICIARLGHTAVTVVYARAIFNLSSGKVGPLVALLLRVGNLVILGYFSKSLFDSTLLQITGHLQSDYK